MGRPAHDVLVGMADQMGGLADAMRSLADDVRVDASAATTPPHSLVEAAVRILAQRKARTRFLPPSLFHEPAWEVLLSLYIAQCRGQTVNIKHLTQAVDAPVTTAQRWIDALAHMRLVHRVVDDLDRRRVELSLTQGAMQAVEGYLSWVVSGEADAQRAPRVQNGFG